MWGLPHTGLIADSKIQQGYVEKFIASLKTDLNYQVYVSDKHGSGAGHYKINETTLDGQKISLKLDFMVDPLELGLAVMNQRIVFLQTEPGCEITKVVLSYPLNDKDKKK